MMLLAEPCLLSLQNDAESIRDLLAGGQVHYVAQSGKTDLSDWVHLMEVVEALCPVWPAAVKAPMKCPGYKL